MKVSEIEIGQTYRVRRGLHGEGKPRTVIDFDPCGRFPGGVVRSHSGLTRGGKQSQVENWSAEYFAQRVLGLAHIKR